MQRQRSWYLLLFLIGLAAMGLGTAEAEETACGVKYVSAEHVYLDAGTAGGLTPGLLVRVVRGSDTIAVLEVLFSAESSSSCKIVSNSAEILPGDTVVYDAVDSSEAPVVAAPAVVLPRTRSVVDKPKQQIALPGPRISGSVALQWDHSDETTDRNLSNEFVSIPFRMRAMNLKWGTEFRTQGSFRHISRAGYSGNTPDAEWRNRIREVALLRDGSQQDFQFALGRISTRYTASAGSFDGLSFNHRIGQSIRVGAFGGFSPDWSTLAISSDKKLAGVSFNFNRKTPDGRYLDVVVAGVGRYNLKQVSREYLTMTTSWRNGTKVSLLQAAEIDINRGWRKTNNTNTLALTSLALNGRYQLIPQVAVNLGFDNRDPVRTWESRSLPDSLFIDAGNTGWRAGLNWRGKRGMNASLFGSLRHRASSGDWYSSYNGMFYLPRLTGADLDVRLAYRAFTGPNISGWSPTVGLSKSTRSGMRLGVEGGYQVYVDNVNGLPDRTNTWFNVSGSGNLSSRLSIMAEYRRDWGDDTTGNRIFMETRYRF